MTDTLRAPTTVERDASAVEEVALTGDRKAPPTSRLTWDEFLAWADEGARAEWVDGEVVFLSPSNIGDLRLITFLHEIIARFVRARELGEVFLTA